MERDFRHDTEAEPNMRTSSPVSGLVERLENRARTKNGAGEGAYDVGYYEVFAAADDREAASTLTSLSTRNAELERGIDRLAAYIMENVPGEPSENQGAVDTAIRLLGKNAELEREVKRLREATPREPTGEMMDSVRHIVQWLQEPTRPTEAGLFSRCSVLRKPLPDGCREGVDHVPPARLIAYWIWTAMHDDALSTSPQGGEHE